MKLIKKLVLGCSIIALSQNIYGAASSSEQPFDQNGLVRQLLTKEITPAQYVDFLAAQTDNDEAQEKLYNVLSKGFLTIAKDEVQARSVLSRAVKAEQTWALWVKSNEMREGNRPTKYDLILANRGHVEANNLFSNVIGKINIEIERLERLTPEKIKREIKSFDRTYGQHAYAHYKLSKVLGKKDLRDESFNCLVKAYNLGGYYGIGKLMSYAYKNFKSEDKSLNRKSYDIYKLILNQKNGRSSLSQKVLDDTYSNLAEIRLESYKINSQKALTYFQKIKNQQEYVEGFWVCFSSFQINQMITKLNHIGSLIQLRKFDDVLEEGHKLLEIKIENCIRFSNGDIIPVNRSYSLNIDYTTSVKIMHNHVNILIGNAYEVGFENYEKALAYYSLCDNNIGQHFIGNLLKKSPERYEEGMSSLTKAAHAGNVSAMIDLVHIYLSTTSHDDEEKGMFWLERANALGDERAKQYLENLEIEESKIQEILELSENPTVPELPSNLVEFSMEDHEEGPELSESSSSSSSSSEPVVEMDPETYPAYTSIRNPKYIRDNLRRIKAERAAEYVQPMLSGKSQMIAQRIWEEDHNVSYNDLRILFSDQAFARHQVSLSLTKNGLMVKAKNTSTGVYETTSTHKAHRGSKTEAFRVQLRELLTTVFPFVIS